MPAVVTAVGISLGTYYFAGGINKDEEVVGLLDGGADLMPAYVAFTPTGYLLGNAAFNQIESNPTNTIYDCKRLLGRFYDDPVTQEYVKEWPFKVVDDANKPKYEVEFKGETVRFSPEEIVALFLKRYKEMAEDALGQPVTEVVITVPAQFDNTQRQATLDAATIAGVLVLQLVNEPTSSVIAHSMRDGQHPAKEEKKTVIISAGSGFLDVSLVSYEERVYECRASLGTTADVDITKKLVQHYAKRFQERHDLDVYQDPKAYIRLWKACEFAKYDITLQKEADIKIDSLMNGVDFKETLQRSTIDVILEPLRQKTLDLFNEALAFVKWPLEEVNEVLLAGGIANVPSIQDGFYELAKPAMSNTILENPELFAVIGAVMMAASLQLQKSLKNDQDSLHNDDDDDDDDDDRQDRGDDHGPRGDHETLEVASQTIGIMTPEGKVRSFVRKNTCIPVTRTDAFTTRADNQARIAVEIYEGDNKIASENKLIGTCYITGYPLRKRGVPLILVTFKIDCNGVLICWAKDRTPDELGNGTVVVINELGVLTREELRYVEGQFHIRFPPRPVPTSQAAPESADGEGVNPENGESDGTGGLLDDVDEEGLPDIEDDDEDEASSESVDSPPRVKEVEVNIALEVDAIPKVEEVAKVNGIVRANVVQELNGVAGANAVQEGAGAVQEGADAVQEEAGVIQEDNAVQEEAGVVQDGAGAVQEDNAVQEGAGVIQEDNAVQEGADAVQGACGGANGIDGDNGVAEGEEAQLGNGDVQEGNEVIANAREVKEIPVNKRNGHVES